MNINPERQYVLLSVKWTKDSLVFWGYLTPDDEERRSFGGYTDDINACERYTLEEIQKESKHFHEYEGQPLYKLKSADRDGTWAIRIDQLDRLGRKTTCYLI